MIVDGRAIAKEILKSVRADVAKLGRVPVVRAVTAEPDAATESYLGVKSRRAKAAGMQLEIVRLAEGATTDDAIQALLAPGADALLVQLPLPAHFDQEAILASIPREKDADVLSPEAYAAFELREPESLVPPVAAAVVAVFVQTNLDLNGRRILVIGNGRLVGKPVWQWLEGEGFESEIITQEQSSELPVLLPQMDVIISGAGSPGLIRPEYLQQGVVLIDAGTSESGGAIVGDADPACAEKASVFTPVPGGVGPIAVACLFRNAAILAERASLHTGQ